MLSDLPKNIYTAYNVMPTKILSTAIIYNVIELSFLQRIVEQLFLVKNSKLIDRNGTCMNKQNRTT